MSENNRTESSLIKIGSYGNQESEQKKAMEILSRGNSFRTKVSLIGVDAANAGNHVPPCLIKNNKFCNTKLKLREQDVTKNNRILENYEGPVLPFQGE